jgi:hypothetical protein
MLEGTVSSQKHSKASGQKLVGVQSILTVVIPVAALILAILSGNRLFLDYMHVLPGALWTGIDLFMGLVIGRIMGQLDVRSRVEFIKRLVPYMLFLMPTLAAVTVTGGIYLAMNKGIFNITYPVIILAGVFVIILIIQGLGIFLPNEVRIFFEIQKPNPDYGKIARLGMINFKLSGLQGVFQIALIFIMANIATGNYFLHF